MRGTSVPWPEILAKGSRSRSSLIDKSGLSWFIRYDFLGRRSTRLTSPEQVIKFTAVKEQLG